ncbi:MAG: methionyl-tRNA formyltransferase [Tannerella sp.]|jgi:methionyl-tRNA formyltransferase|nr:methionyl-tRNA formyltransferase [Tannerella sp.]
MKKEDLRIIFMGTPEFAVASLKALVESGYNVVGVVTVADKPIGRHGSELQPSPVKQYALSQGLTVLQPEKLRDENFILALDALNADVQIVVAFRMLPQAVWSMPRYGCINLHASLLPQYRGAAPINHAVMNGETETGVTTFFITHDIDTGKIIKQIRIPIADDDNAGAVHDRLMTVGAALVVETVEMIINGNGNVASTPQHTDSVLHPAPKIFKETCAVNWSQPVVKVYDFIRGLSPYPAAHTEIVADSGVHITMKIFACEKLFEQHSSPPGSIRTDNKTFLDIACNDGFLRILTLQVAGKKTMSVKNFLNGNTLV